VSASWVDSPWLLYDLETTSPEPTECRTVTATLIELDEARRSTIHEWVIDPGVPVPDEAAAIHGWTTERVQAEGVEPRGAVTEIARRINAAWSDGIPLLAFNASFDCTVTDSEMARHLGTRLSRPLGPVLDPHVLDKACDRYRKGSRRLADVCAHYEVEAGESHQSQSDALAAGRVMWRLTRVFPELAAMTLSELQDYQAKAYVESATSLQKYKRRKAKEDGASADEIARIVIPTEWPLRQSPPEGVAA
jgi:DNA polymerase-3 subunit epsilon